jgi:hypothetical protein
MVEQVLTKKKVRSSNIELFRIFLMLMIIAHHYTTSSGLNSFAFNNSEAISFNRIFLLFYSGGEDRHKLFYPYYGLFHV